MASTSMAMMWNEQQLLQQQAQDADPSSSRGTKRPAESQFTDLERFNKRLNALTIGGPSHAKSNLFIPKPTTTPLHDPINVASLTKTPSDDRDELMHVDDTPDRVYIHDLDAELADVESHEEKLIFLPDIEKKLSRLPRQLLEHSSDHENHELVLYSLPKSLTAGQGHDSVRKAIIESRQRARDKAAEEARHLDTICKYDQAGLAVEPAEIAHGYNAGFGTSNDPDAMDMD